MQLVWGRWDEPRLGREVTMRWAIPGHPGVRMDPDPLQGCGHPRGHPQTPDHPFVFCASFQAGEMGLKALELVKQLPQQESREAIARLLRLINSAPSRTK